MLKIATFLLVLLAFYPLAKTNTTNIISKRNSSESGREEPGPYKPGRDDHDDYQAFLVEVSYNEKLGKRD